MDRINGINVAPNLHGAGKDGWRDGNKALGIPATVVNAEFLNSLQEEIANVIEGQGITLDVGDKTQLKQAIERMVKGGDYKQSVRIASTANIAALSGLAAIDGVTPIAGDRILVKDQSTSSQNGIYVAAAGAWARATDADTGAEFNSGAITPVEEGTVNANTNWQMTNDGAVTIGVTGLTFQQVNMPADASETVKGVVELATDLEAQGFTANKFIDGAKLNTALKGANQSLVVNGYQKLPGGLIIQWGVFAGSASADTTVTFPIAFPNNCFSVGVGSNRTGTPASTIANMNSQTVNGFSGSTWGGFTTRIAVSAYWIAVGN